MRLIGDADESEVGVRNRNIFLEFGEWWRNSAALEAEGAAPDAAFHFGLSGDADFGGYGGK